MITFLDLSCFSFFQNRSIYIGLSHHIVKEISAFPDKAGNKWSHVLHKEIIPIINFMEGRGLILMTEKY